MGDFNLYWLGQTAKDIREEEYVERVMDYFLELYVMDPILEQDILDLVMISEEGLIRDLVV